MNTIQERPNEVSIKRNYLLMILFVIIALFLLLLFREFGRQEPPLQPNVITFLGLLSSGQYRGVTIIDVNGNIKAFDPALNEYKPCASVDDIRNIPKECSAGLGEPKSKRTTISVVIYPNPPTANEPVIVMGVDDPKLYRLHRCPDGSMPAC